jgi:hypothetical protein
MFKELIPTLFKIFQAIGRLGTPPKSFYESSSILIPNWTNT